MKFTYTFLLIFLFTQITSAQSIDTAVVGDWLLVEMSLNDDLLEEGLSEYVNAKEYVVSFGSKAYPPLNKQSYCFNYYFDHRTPCNSLGAHYTCDSTFLHSNCGFFTKKGCDQARYAAEDVVGDFFDAPLEYKLYNHILVLTNTKRKWTFKYIRK